MTWRLVEESTTVAPRRLQRRLTRRGFPNAGAIGDYGGDPVESTHMVWRCSHCRALAVGKMNPPGSCGKCGAKG